jgi:hypothetical protein
LRLNKRTIIVSTAALTLAGGAAFAYTVAAPALGAGSGNMAAAGVISVGSVTTDAVVLDTPTAVHVPVSATGQPVGISTVVVAPGDGLNGSTTWDTAHCGPAISSKTVTLASVVNVPADSSVVTLDDPNLTVTLPNITTLNQTSCALHLKVTVS